MRLLLPVFLIFLFGVGVGRLWSTHEVVSAHEQEIREGGYRFVNPLLECEPAGNLLGERELRPFRDKIADLIKGYKQRGWVTHASVYFRDLNNGPAFGIDVHEKFAPASLLKVPSMMALFKEAERYPGILHAKVRYDGKIDAPSQNVTASAVIEEGASYTLDELAYRMIVYSDNHAQGLLLNNMKSGFFEKAYRDLGLSPPNDQMPDDFMTVKEYATFFRILFNASYLNRDFSEKALEYLSKVEFRDGLVAGVPPDIPVAHKFGERILGRSEIKQLHECGIVYYPQHPYLLCVMSRGSSFPYQNDVIREISQVVYKEVDAHNATR